MNEKGVLYFTDYAGHADGAVPAIDAGACSSRSSELIRTAQTYLEQHAAENVTVDDTAAVCHVSPAHLMRQFKKETGCSVHAWLTRYRIQKACGLIRQGLPITVACEQLGYTDYPLFYRNFCKITGSSPRAWQKECGEHAAGGEHRVLHYADWHWSGYRGDGAGMKLRRVRNALWIIFAVLFVLYLAVFYAGRKGTASSEKETDGGDSLEIYVWMDEVQTFDALSRGFMERYPDITVNVHYAPTDEYTQSCLEKLSDMDCAVDVCGFSVPSAAAQMVSKGLLAPLEEQIAGSAALESIHSLTGQINAYEDGHTYSVPYRNSAWVVYYNKKIFDAAGVEYPSDDWTWEEYAETAAKVSSPAEGIYGSMNYNSSWWRVPARTAGAEYPLDPEDLEEFLYAAEWNYTLTYAERAATPYDTLTTAGGKDYISRFLGGEAAMMYNGEWCLSMLNRRILEENLDFTYDVVPLPHWEGKEGRAIGSLASLCIAEKSDRKDLAWRFIEFASGEEGARILAGLSYLPACDTPEIRSIFRNSLSMPEHTEYFFSTEKISSFPGTNRYTISMNYLNNEVMSYLMGEKSLEDAEAAYYAQVSDTLGGME